MMDSADETLRAPVSALGNPVGLGRTAEVFAYGTDGIVKLLRPGFPPRLGEHASTYAAEGVTLQPQVELPERTASDALLRRGLCLVEVSIL